MTSRATILTVVYGIIAVTLIALCGVIWLSSVDQEVPDTLTNIVVAGLAALTGILASTRSGLGANEKEPSMTLVSSASGTGSGAAGTGAMPGSSAPPLEVTVTNAPTDPVPVDHLPVSPRDPR